MYVLVFLVTSVIFSHYHDFSHFYHLSVTYRENVQNVQDMQNMKKMQKQSKHSTPGSAVPLAMFPVVFCQITKFDSGYVCFDHRNDKLIDIFKFKIVHV